MKRQAAREDGQAAQRRVRVRVTNDETIGDGQGTGLPLTKALWTSHVVQGHPGRNLDDTSFGILGLLCGLLRLRT